MRANRKITAAALAGIVLGALTMVVSGNAALVQDTVRVRGTIESIARTPWQSHVNRTGWATSLNG